MKHYEELKLLVISFENSDVICQSQDFDSGVVEDNYDWIDN